MASNCDVLKPLTARSERFVRFVSTPSVRIVVPETLRGRIGTTLSPKTGNQADILRLMW